MKESIGNFKNYEMKKLQVKNNTFSRKYMTMFLTTTQDQEISDDVMAFLTKRL